MIKKDLKLVMVDFSGEAIHWESSGLNINDLSLAKLRAKLNPSLTKLRTNLIYCEFKSFQLQGKWEPKRENGSECPLNSACNRDHLDRGK